LNSAPIQAPLIPKSVGPQTKNKYRQ